MLPRSIPSVGDPAPWFFAQSTLSETDCFRFAQEAGKRLVFFFFGRTTGQGVAQVLADLDRLKDSLAALGAVAYGICSDPEDQTHGKPQAIAPGLPILWDLNYAIAQAYGVARLVWPHNQAPVDYQPQIIVVDYNLYLRDRLLLGNPGGFVSALMALLNSLTPIECLRSLSAQAPILRLPHILDPATCRWLIEQYHEHGGTPSGYMKEGSRPGETIGVLDDSFKRRQDWLIRDPDTWNQLHQHFVTRLFPAIERAFHYKVTQVERYLVACYDQDRQGFFKAHHDNTTPATAHRRFALSMNLNGGEFEGGLLRFPEFEHHGYCAATGEALVFSGALLHEVTPVKRGCRYTLLSFFY